jgi:hypothetical protein
MDFEGTSDIFIKCCLDGQNESLETDCHYRCMDGNPDFQYRLLFNVKYPSDDLRLRVIA